MVDENQRGIVCGQRLVRLTLIGHSSLLQCLVLKSVQRLIETQGRCQLLTSSKRLILKVGMRKYLRSCQNCQRRVDASLLKTSFVNTPQRNLTFSLINCSSTLAPSAPMAVRL